MTHSAFQQSNGLVGPFFSLLHLVCCESGPLRYDQFRLFRVGECHYHGCLHTIARGETVAGVACVCERGGKEMEESSALCPC